MEHIERRADQFGEGYNLVTDSQDVEDIMSNYVKGDDWVDFCMLFVIVGDGEYDEIWASEDSVCWIWSKFMKLPVV